MGADIHSIGQIKKDGKWTTKIARVGGDNRDYDTFAVLADVRNGRGFGGVATGEGWPVFAEPKGLPDDIIYFDDVENEDSDEGEKVAFVSAEEAMQGSPRVKLEEPYYYSFDKDKKDPTYYLWLGEHSFSHFTLKELKELREFVLKERPTYEESGMITKKAAEELKQGKLPEMWCGSTSDKNYVEATWKRPTLECLWLLQKQISELEQLAKETETSEEDTRIVFGFDN